MINFRGRFGRPLWHYLVLPVVLLLLAVILLTPMIVQTESTLKIRPNQQGLSLPDGFYLYQHLNGRGIHIKSIIPENDSLVVSLEFPSNRCKRLKFCRMSYPRAMRLSPVNRKNVIAYCPYSEVINKT